jgi:type VI secretion system protein ImpJ
MKITRPLWAKGVFMTPQHFQQQALWSDFRHARTACLASPEPWGLQSAAIDAHALSVGRLQMQSLHARLPDGTWIDTSICDRLPPPRSLQDVPRNCGSTILRISLPLWDPQGRNVVEDGDKPARPRRFIREYLQVGDLHGEDQDEIGVERNALAVLFEHEPDSDHVSCPVARLVRGAQGQFELDPDYVPPCLVLSASQCLMQRAQRLAEILAAKSASLARRRKERTDQIADYAVADVALFWLLHSVNTSWPELARLCQAPDQHPERLYTVLARLAGSLLTFSTTDSLASIPRYDHRDPEPVFAELEQLIRGLLDTVIPSSVVPIALEPQRPTMWVGQFNDVRLVENADYYLAVRAAIPAHELLELFPRLCKIGAPDDVQQIINAALPGIPLRAMSRLPAAIPLRIENQYFALDSAHPAFARMVAARACQVYVPASLTDAALELYAVLPA